MCWPVRLYACVRLDVVCTTCLRTRPICVGVFFVFACPPLCGGGPQWHTHAHAFIHVARPLRSDSGIKASCPAEDSGWAAVVTAAAAVVFGALRRRPGPVPPKSAPRPPQSGELIMLWFVFVRHNMTNGEARYRCLRCFVRRTNQPLRHVAG